MARQKISVILPVRNGANFIETCVESFLEQTLKDCDKELIIVNDNSVDETLQLARLFAEKHTQIRVIDNPNEGVIEALIIGLMNSTGNLVSRMDVDDVMPTNKLQALLDILKDPNVDVATGKVKYFHKEKISVGDGYKKYEKWLNLIVDDQAFYDEIYKECVVASPNWLMEKETLERVGGFHGIYPEDYDLVFRFYEHELKIRGANEVTHHWYDHSVRTSRNSDLYRENNFFDLKLRYFFRLDYDVKREILIYGAGNKGKYLAKKFIDQKAKISWCTNNPNKVGKEIYGVKLISDQDPITSLGCQIIIAIAIQKDQIIIEERLQKAGLVRGVDYFFFA